MRRPHPTVWLSAAAATLAWATHGKAQGPSPNPNAPSLPSSALAADNSSPAPAADEGAALAQSPEEQRWLLVEQELQEVRERLQRAEDARSKEVSPLTLSGYVDLGFFAPLGNDGVGWVRDVGNRQRPDLDSFAWTFLGDILGSPINSRGEAADLGDGTAIDRFDSV
ncbi:MAG: hypothetical protein RL685_3701, partial [Pseudomonadota bacterium]